MMAARSVFPTGPERRLRQLLQARVQRLFALAEKRLTVRNDASVSAVRREWRVSTPDLRKELLGVAKQVDTWTNEAVVREIQRIAAIDVRERLEAVDHDTMLATWARENAKLVRSVEDQHLDKLAELVQAEVARGTTNLADVIADRFGVAARRAKTIARTEVARLNAQITQRDMLDVGFTHYRWSTSGDERVRPEHVALDGTVRAWDDPHPSEGHPGWAVNCRCTALPELT